MSLVTVSAAAPRVNDNVRGAGFMLLAMAMFATNDMIVKLMTAALPTGQIMAVRGVMTSVLLVALALWRHGGSVQLRPLRQPAMLLRVAADVGATISYITALAHLPIANASAIFQASPLVVTVGAAVFLGERVGPRRWIAILVGFVGVLIIVRPGFEGSNVFALAVLLSVVCSAARDLATKRIAKGVPTFHVAGLTAIAVTATGFVMMAIPGGPDWVPLDAGQFALLAVASVFLLVGYVAIVSAMRSGDMGFVAPFRYAVLVFAIGLGFVVFGELPTILDLLGAAIVVGSGAAMLLHERRRHRLVPAKANLH